MIEGPSTDPDTLAEVKAFVSTAGPVMVVLDSNHTHDHVLAELELYSLLVDKGSYLIVLDTVVEDLPDEHGATMPWGRGNNPKTAVHAFLSRNDRFVIDHEIHDKLVLTSAPDGYLRCVGAI